MGPILHLRGLCGDRLKLSAVVVRPASDPVPELSVDEAALAPSAPAERCGRRVYVFDFHLPARADASYRLDGVVYPVNAAVAGDLRIAFVSCNGQEFGDRGTPLGERNAMWARLGRQHADRPFNLLLHGGDQIYADEILDTHPPVREWAHHGRRSGTGGPSTDAIRDALGDALFTRYVELYSQPELAWIAARVPALAMWDDHDICDGWGSLPESKLDSPIGRAVFENAREHFMLFQLGATPGRPPEICADGSGTSLGWHVGLPGLHLIAPDLRSERRPRRVMGECGWRSFRKSASAARAGQVLLLSSVPVLGPRLSWVEAIMHVTPRMEKYEDDLRDQWQSRAHRGEWREFLRHLVAIQSRDDAQVTVLSGEIHLATRATMATKSGPLHQLVASGIAHPAPPPGYARGLGALARLGESPLPDNPIRLHPLPGRSAIYTGQRNYLILERRDGHWSAWWELEEDGPTPRLALNGAA